MAQPLTGEDQELSVLCDSVRRLARKGDYEECERRIANAMSRHPHAPQPHNLMGVLFEIKNDHVAAMKHFRAAWSLDPTYLPARHNLDHFASFYPKDQCAFDENDCRVNEKKYCVKVEYDSRGIGHVIKGK